MNDLFRNWPMCPSSLSKFALEMLILSNQLYFHDCMYFWIPYCYWFLLFQVPVDSPWKAKLALKWDTMTVKEFVDSLAWTRLQCNPFLKKEGRKEMFYLTTHSTFLRGNEEEMFYLTTHSTHFIYGYMASVLNECVTNFYSVKIRDYCENRIQRFKCHHIYFSYFFLFLKNI